MVLCHLFLESKRDAILLHRDWGRREPNFHQLLFLPKRVLSGG